MGITYKINAQSCPTPKLGAKTVGETQSCNPLNFGYIISDYATNDPITTYEVDFGDGETLILNHDDLDESGTHTIYHNYEKVSCETVDQYYTFTITAGKACATFPKEITISPVIIGRPPEPEFSFDTPACVNEALLFFNETVDGLNFECNGSALYRWDFGDGETLETTDKTNPNHVYPTTGTFTVTLTVVQDCGNQTVSHELTVDGPPKPEFEIGNPGNVNTINDCTSPPQTFFPLDNCIPVAVPIRSLTSGSGLSESWSISSSTAGGATFSGGGTTSTEAEETISFSEPGEYVITLTAASDCGSEQSCVSVTVASAPPPEELNIYGIDNNLCIPAMLDLSTDEAADNTYDWEIFWVESSSIINPTNSNTHDPNPVSLTTGTYEITLTVSNSCGSNSVTEEIIVTAPPPSSNIEQGNSSICEGESITLNTQEDAAFTYQWQLDGTDIEGATDYTYEASVPGIYTVAILTGNCGSVSDPVTITLQEAPEAIITAPEQIAFCEDEDISALLQANTGTDLTYQWLIGGVEIPAATNSTYTATEAGEYTVEVSAGTCASLSEAVTIEVTPPPTFQLSLSDLNICANTPTTLSMEGDAANYTWAPATGLNTTEGNTVIVNIEEDITYTVTAETIAGCTEDITFTLSVLPIPEIEATPSQELICPGDTVDIEVSGATSYKWITNPFLEATGETEAIAFPQETTTFQVIGFNEQGCADTAEVKIEVRSIPGLSAEDESVCISDPAFSLGLDLPEGINGTWSAPQLAAGSLSPEGIFDPQLAGVDVNGHTVTFTYETDDPLACASSLTKKVFVHPLPEPAFSVPPVVCVGEEVSFNNQTEGNFSYRWTVEDATYNTESPTHSFQTVAEASTIWLYAESPEGCIDSIFQKVQVVEAPLADFSMSVEPVSLCGPVTVSFTNLSEGELVDYLWDFGNGESSTEASPPPITFEPGVFGDTAYVVSLSVTNTCTTIEMVDTVQVRPQPVANFLFEKDTICADYPLRIHNYSLGLAEEFEWYFGFEQDMLPFTTDETGTFTQAFPYTGDTDTTYYISLVAKNACGTDTLTRPLVVTPNEVEAFYHIDRLQGCGPLEVMLTTNQVAGNSNSITIAWGDGDTTQGNIVAQHIYQNPGTYYPQLIVQNGCSIDICGGEGDTDCGLAIQVFPTPLASFAPLEPICITDSVRLNNTSHDGVDSEWDFGDGRTYFGTSPPPFTYAQSGTYTITLTTANQYACRSTAFEQTIVVNPLPTPSFQVAESYCQDEPIQIENTSSGATSYQWMAEGLGVISTEQHLNYEFTQEGTYSLSLRAFNGSELEGCSAEYSETVRIVRPAEPSFEMDRISDCEGERVNFINLTTYPSDGSGVFEWDFGNGATYTGINNIPSQLYPYPPEGTASYTVSLTVQSEGCSNTYQQQIEVGSFAGVIQPEGDKPLAFTPTASTNNQFRLNFIQLTTIDLRIYSREGVEVFRTEDPNESWDGHYRGELAPAGLYNVQVSYTNCAGYSDNDVLQLYLLLNEF